MSQYGKANYFKGACRFLQRICATNAVDNYLIINPAYLLLILWSDRSDPIGIQLLQGSSGSHDGRVNARERGDVRGRVMGDND